jgi:type IV secretion system protein VirB9
MRVSKIPIVILAAIPAWSCASRPAPPARYVKASPLQEPVRAPAVIQVPTPLPLPGQLQRVPVPGQAHRGEKRQTWEVIDDANRKATASPDRDGYFNAIMTYDFADGALFQVYAAPLRLTAIQL